MSGVATTVGAALRAAEKRFEAAEIEAPRTQSVALLGHVLGHDRAAVLARLADALDEQALDAFRAVVERRLQREPLQYILGRAHFLDFSLRVGPRVFIPRPETEQLVAATLAAWDPADPVAVDVCCGSGAVAIALARARPEARIVAIDRSPFACAATRRNAAELGVSDSIQVVRGDLLACLPHPSTRVGVVVCNPPYAADGEVSQPEVLDHEPQDAIVSGPEGTEVYRRIIPQAATLLAPGRSLLLELGFGREAAVRDLFRIDGWENPVVEDDFQGIPRVLAARTRRADPTASVPVESVP
jgi:release factor glutamine methyltransferase